MSLDLYPRETAEHMRTLAPARVAEVGLFDGFLRGAGLYTMQGLVKGVSGIDLAMSVGPIAADAITGGTEAQDRHFSKHDETFGPLIDYFSPNANETGAAAEIAGALVSTLAQFAISPSLAVGSLQLSTAEDLVKKGVDPGIANLVGATQGAGLGLGIYLPVLGRTLLQRILTGAGANVGLGIGMRGAAQAILQGTAAEGDYRAFDPTSFKIDLLLGAAFGTATHLSPKARAQSAEAWARIEEFAKGFKASDVDALSTLRQALHLNSDSMPGKPLEPVDAENHVQRVKTALEQLLRDQPVDVSDLPAPRFEADMARMDENLANIRTLLQSAEEVRKSEGLPRPPEPRLPERDIVSPIDRNAPPEEKVRQVEVLSRQNEQPVRKFLAGIDEEFGTTSGVSFKKPENIIEKSTRPYIRAAKPWFDIEHVRDAFRFKTVISDLRQLPEIIGRVSKLGATVVKADVGKIINPKEWGWRIPSFDLRMPNGQIVEYYLPIKEQEAAKKVGNHALFEKWRSRDLGKLTHAERLEYEADVTTSRKSYQQAWEAYLKRSGITGTELLASLRKAEALASGTMEKSSLSSSAENLMPGTQAPPIREAAYPLSSTRTLPSSALDTSIAAKTSTDIVSQIPILTDIAAGIRQLVESGAPAAKRGEGTLPPPRGFRDVEAAGAEGTKVDPLAFEAHRVVNANPDLKIRLGQTADGEPIVKTLKEYLADQLAAADAALKDVPLFEAAATCLFGRA